MGIQSKSIDKLFTLKDSVSVEARTGLAVAGTAIAATAVATVPIYDEKGVLLGYVALFDTANLT